MKILGALGISIMLLFLLASAPAYSQERDENKPTLGQEEKDKAKRSHGLCFAHLAEQGNGECTLRQACVTCTPTIRHEHEVRPALAMFER